MREGSPGQTSNGNSGDRCPERSPENSVAQRTECDILPNGDLDWPDEFLKEFDYVVASVHSNFKMPEEAMTRRIIKALTNKHVTMLGHPTGRLLLARNHTPWT